MKISIFSQKNGDVMSSLVTSQFKCCRFDSRCLFSTCQTVFEQSLFMQSPFSKNQMITVKNYDSLNMKPDLMTACGDTVKCLM